MKFGHAYKEFLDDGGFPDEWVHSAISYQKLKKCIKRVKQELASLGLDSQTLQQLLNRAELAQAEEAGRVLRYEFENGEVKDRESHIPAPVKPKLLFLVDDETGEPMDARLAPETKSYIHQLAINEKLTNIRISDFEDSQDVDPDIFSDAGSSRRPSKAHRLIEVPLSSDSEFFNRLQTELSGLANLQATEKTKLHSEISTVGRSLSKATEPSSSKGKADLAHWRRLFELYIESRIFFSTTEKNHGLQNFSTAQDRYAKFLDTANGAGLLKKFKNKESADALQGFLKINGELLMNLRFQEINQIAMTKILKKFDKRTSLQAQSTFPLSSSPLSPLYLSKSLSQTLSQEITSTILSTIPSLDDYLCPICSELAWRPIRLRCTHIFCIRCLIRLQREQKDKCPLCRESVVMQADGTCLDESMIRYLKMWFPKEVKEKQRINERLATQDEFGDVGEGRCVVM